MIYLDANIFVRAAIDIGNLGEVARNIICALEENECSAITSCLTIDEVIWVVRRILKSYKLAVSSGEKLFKIRGLKIVPAMPEDVLRAFDLMKQGLRPRDAIHAATALNHSIFTIVTEDPDFKKVKSLKVSSLLEFLKRIKRD